MTTKLQEVQDKIVSNVVIDRLTNAKYHALILDPTKVTVKDLQVPVKETFKL